jgi:hypothetical protein
MSSFFSLKSAKVPSATREEYTLPTTDDPLISAFYAQLNDKERVAHAIAVTKLGTSYDVIRTHGFLKWSAKQKQQQ